MYAKIVVLICLQNILRMNGIVFVSQLQVALNLLQRIEPNLKELKVTRTEALAKHPERLKVLKNHARASDYMI